MQPLARPVTRAAWGIARLRLAPELVPRPQKASFGRNDATMICLRCRTRTTAASARFYSSQSPKDGTEKSSPVEPAAVRDAQTSTQELPSTTEGRRGTANQKFSHLMDTLQTRVMNASHTLNDITGYSGIEAIKADNARLEAALLAAHASVRSSRLAYKTSNARRANTQREVTTLLARKDTWSPTDLERFTELYRADHELEGEVAGAQESLTEAEAEEQRLSQTLNAGMLKRYHEEQIWSDRIRRASTWGTWGLMGMNFLLFVVLQFFAEPWRRRRLVKGVVEQEKGVLEEVRGELAAVREAIAKRDAGEALQVSERAEADEVVAMEETVKLDDAWQNSGSWKEFILDPARWKLAAADLYSERRLDLRMKDASVLALEGAVTGAAIAGSIALVLMRR